MGTANKKARDQSKPEKKVDKVVEKKVKKVSLASAKKVRLILENFVQRLEVDFDSAKPCHQGEIRRRKTRLQTAIELLIPK